jgi:hypothetical protein
MLIESCDDGTRPPSVMEVVMEKTTVKRTLETAGEEFVRMYPCNQLTEQKRDPKDTLSAFKVMRDHFVPQN